MHRDTAHLNSFFPGFEDHEHVEGVEFTIAKQAVDPWTLYFGGHIGKLLLYRLSWWHHRWPELCYQEDSILYFLFFQKSVEAVCNGLLFPFSILYSQIQQKAQSQLEKLK